MEKVETTAPPASESKISAMRHLKIYNKQDVLSLTNLRRFETKLGERLLTIADSSNIEKSLANSPAKYVLFGIPEDLGAKGNYGIGGTDTVWMPVTVARLHANVVPVVALVAV